jgi:hypothetical protein
MARESAGSVSLLASYHVVGVVTARDTRLLVEMQNVEKLLRNFSTPAVHTYYSCST